MKYQSLVTGGHGFIGSHISGTVNLKSTDLDLLNFEDTLNYFSQMKFSDVIHCAAKISSAIKMKVNHHNFLIRNLQMDINVLEASRLSGVRNLITVGSISGLQANTEGYIDESCLNQSPAIEINYGYNVEKYFQPYLVTAYQLDFKLNYKSILLSNCYGPGARILEDSPLVSSLIYKISTAKENNEDLELYGTGEDLRNLTYVGDLESIFWQHLGNQDNLEPLIIASPFILRIREIAEIIANILKYDGKITFRDADSKFLPTHKICKNDKLMALDYSINWTPPEQGLQLTLEKFL